MHSKRLRLGQTLILLSCCFAAKASLAQSIEELNNPVVKNEVGTLRVLDENGAAGKALGMSHGAGWKSYVKANRMEALTPEADKFPANGYEVGAGASVKLSEDKSGLRTTRLVMGYSYGENTVGSHDTLSAATGALPDTSSHQVQLGLSMNF